jgi:hypothetical protein
MLLLSTSWICLNWMHCWFCQSTGCIP